MRSLSYWYFECCNSTCLQESCCISSAPYYEEGCSPLTGSTGVKDKPFPRKPLLDEDR